MTDKKKEKEFVVEQVYVQGYVKHTNGKKSPFVFDKTSFDPKDLTGICKRIMEIYK